MSQHPLFAKPAVVTAVITVNVTQDHIDRAESEGLHPVSLAVIDAFPGTEDADVIRDGAYAWHGDEVTFLRFGRDGTAFVHACDGHSAVSPVTFTAEVIKP
jgi:hypothetical protein